MADWSLTFAALWTALDGDETLTPLMVGGTKYRFAGGLLKRMELEPARCPILAVGPAPEGSHLMPARRRRGSDLEDRFAVQIELATSGQEAAQILHLLQAVRNCIEANIGDAFGLNDSGPHEAEFQGVRFDLVPSEKGPTPFWTCSVVCVFRFRSP